MFCEIFWRDASYARNCLPYGSSRSRASESQAPAGSWTEIIGVVDILLIALR